MSIIRVLPVSLRNKIAAGEVVERPASVIKELIENSIDAGSTRIAVDTAHAGKRLIKVSDNGSGMEREDALLAFERYATSKIREEQDLFCISTMGFRGEALSSIAAVSKMKLATAPQAGIPGYDHQSSIGTCIEIAGGDIKEILECPASGTAIEVKDLFYNTPARRKFLKSDTTENYHIIDTITREAISHFSIGFTLRMDGAEALNLPSASSHKERLLQIYGKEFVDGLMETEVQDSRMSIKAFLSKTAQVRNNKAGQFVFINRRPVKDQSVTYAVYKAYEDRIPRDKHPLFFILLEMNPAKVDFNVHPAKREVRFEDKGSVFTFVHKAARTALMSQSAIPAPHPPIEENRVPADNSRTVSTGSQPVVTNAYETYGDGAAHKALQMVSEHVDTLYSGSTPFLYLGDTLVAIPGRDGIIIMDYHAAHERINYERFLRRMDIRSCPLLFPQQVKLQTGDYRVILDNLQVLGEFGLEAEDFGHGAIIVRSLPEALRDADLGSLMSDVASALLNKDAGSAGAADSGKDLEPLDSRKRLIAARLACHSSIRGKEVPDGARLAALMKSLDAADNPNTCPHGRPTRIVISLGDLRKMFKK